MKAKILDKKEDKLFKREIVRIEVEHTSSTTPNRKMLLQEASKLLNKEMQVLALKKINSIYGESKSIATIHVYKNRKDLESNEPKFIIKRNTFKEEEKPAEQAPAESPKEEEKKEGE